LGFGNLSGAFAVQLREGLEFAAVSTAKIREVSCKLGTYRLVFGSNHKIIQPGQILEIRDYLLPTIISPSTVCHFSTVPRQYHPEMFFFPFTPTLH